MTAHPIRKLFADKKENILSVFYTAGFPELEDTGRTLLALQEAGADLVEVGIPFSDPIADGPTIQHSSEVALKNGMTLSKLFDQLKAVKDQVKLPVLLMGYLNPVLQYGMERFCQSCKEAGVSGLILPDLPLYEYEETYKEMFEAYGLTNIFLITPQTSEERIRKIDDVSDGFIYMVSSASTTGAKQGLEEAQVRYFEKIKQMSLRNPALIGFGISNRDTFRQACDHAAGAIIGSAFINQLERSRDLEKDIKSFIKEIKVS